MIQVYRKEGYRSNPMVNQDEDMIQVTLRLPKISWHLLTKTINESGYFDLEDNEE